jgi:hypothetical protein
MTIGIAIGIAMVLYLIDRNKVWKQAAMIVGALALLAVLGVAGIVGWDKYDAWRRARKEQEANQQAQAAWDKWLDGLPTCKVVTSAPDAAKVGRTYVLGEKHTLMIDGVDVSADKVDFVTPDVWDKVAAEDAHDTFPCKAQWIDPQRSEHGRKQDSEAKKKNSEEIDWDDYVQLSAKDCAARIRKAYPRAYGCGGRLAFEAQS